MRKRVIVDPVRLSVTYKATRADSISGAASVQYLDHEEEREQTLSRLCPPQKVVMTFA